jgi:hypothetical protein
METLQEFIARILSEPAESQASPNGHHSQDEAGEALTPEERETLTSLLVPHWHEPQRHSLSLALAAWLARNNVREADAVALIEAIATRAGDTEVRDRVRAITDTYRKVRLGEPVRGEADLVELLPAPTWRALRAVLEPTFVRTGGESKQATKQTAARDTLSLTRLSDVLAEPEEHVAWAVDGLLPAGGLSLLAARPKVGKSTLARNLALAVARGEPFLGRATTPGTVLYLAFEEKRAEIVAHFRRLCARDEPILLFVGSAPEHALEALVDVVARERPALVILDPVLRFVRVRDVNDYSELTKALEPLLMLARTSGAHILLVHHLAKGEHAGGDGILGSTAIFGVVDTALLLKRHADGTRIIETIQRYGTDLPESVLTLDDRGAVVLAGTVMELKEHEAEEAILAVLDEPLTEPEIREQTQLQATLVGRVLRTLVTRGAVTRSGDGKRGNPFRYRRTA